MSRIGTVCLLFGCLAIATSGCAICCSPFDEAYSAYGGSWQRDDPYHGRVGSAFAPAGGPATIRPDAMVPAETTLEQPESVEGDYEPDYEMEF